MDFYNIQQQNSKKQNYISHYTSLKESRTELNQSINSALNNSQLSDIREYFNEETKKYEKIFAINDIIYVKNLSEQPIINNFRKKIFIFDFEECQDFDSEKFLLVLPLFIAHMDLDYIKSLYMNLYDKCLGNENLKKILKTFLFLPDKLTYINFNLRICSLTAQTGQILGEFLSQFEELEAICLNLKYNQIKNQGFQDLISNLQGMINLQSLHIDLTHNYITQLERGHLPITLKSLSLNLSFNKISGTFSIRISGMLRKLHNLETLGLYLQECDLDDGKLKNFAESLPKLQKLTQISLGLSWNYIQQEGLQTLGQTLQKLPNLQSLSIDLSNNTLTFPSLQSLFTPLQNCQKLQNLYLNFQQNELQYEPFDPLIAPLKSLKNLLSLTLWFDSTANSLSLETEIQTLKTLHYVSIFPKPSHLEASIDHSFKPEKAAATIPHSSPYYKMKGFQKLSSCCHPYAFIRKFFDFSILQKPRALRTEDLETLGRRIRLYEKNDYCILNHMHIDKTFFQTLIRHLQEMNVMNRMNLLLVNMKKNSILFKEKEDNLRQRELMDNAVLVYDYIKEEVEEYIFDLSVQDFMDRYKIYMDKQLSYCALGIVYDGYDKDNKRQVAIKSITVKSDIQDELIQKQLKLHQDMSDYTQIATLINFCRNEKLDFINETHSTTYLISLEKGTGFLVPEINQKLKNHSFNYKEVSMTEKNSKVQETVEEFIKIAEILRFLHSKKMVHLNLHHSKFLKNQDNRIFISDLGQFRVQLLKNSETLAKIEEKYKFENPGFKSRYSSPELYSLIQLPKFRRHSYLKEGGGLFNYLYKSDIYQLGLIFLNTLGVRFLPSNREFMWFQQKIDLPQSELSQEEILKFRFEFLQNFQPDTIQLINITNLIRQMLSVKMENRPELDIIIDHLKSNNIN